MKKLVLLWLFVLCAVAARAQFSTVSATVTDSDSTVWANGSWSVQFTPNPSNPNPSVYNINGTPLSPSITQQGGPLNGSGHFSMSVYLNNLITPVGSQWTLKICPNAVTACGSYTFAANGTPIDLSSVLTSVIPAPRFAPVAGTYGYVDAEAVLQLKPGSTYWNVTSNVQRCYNTTSATWGQCGSGGGGGLTSVNSQTGPNVNIHSSDSSVTVTTTTNDINLQVSGAGGNAVSYLPSNTVNFFIGDSRFLIASQPSSSGANVTAVSCNGTTCSATGTQTFTANQHIEMQNAWSPTCINGNQWYTNTVVSGVGLSGTTFQFPESDTACTGTVSGTGGSVLDGTYIVPWQTSREPFFKNQTTFYNHSIPAASINTYNTGYATIIQPWDPTTTGNPNGILHIQLGAQDMLNGTTAATAEGWLQTLWATAHSRGWKIDMTTIIAVRTPNFNDAQSEYTKLLQWIWTQKKNTANSASNAYWDYMSDAAGKTGYAYNSTFFQLISDPVPDHLWDQGAAAVADSINEAFSTQSSNPPTQITGISKGPIIADETDQSTDTPGASGMGTYDHHSYAGNQDPGYFTLHQDESSSPPTPTIITPFFTFPTLRFRRQTYDLNGGRLPTLGTSGGWCWSSDRFNSATASIEDCFTRFSSGTIALGNGTSSTDTSGFLIANFIPSGVSASTNPVCPNGTNGALTTTGCAGSSLTRTCNGNGCYIKYSDGTFHMWGVVSVSFSSSTLGTAIITFPTTFTTTSNLALVVTAGASPSGTTDAVTAYQTSLSTSGAIGVIRCAVNIGGSGCPNVTTTVPLHWQADGN